MKVKTHGSIPFTTFSILPGMVLEADLHDHIVEHPLGDSAKSMYMVEVGGVKAAFPTYHAAPTS